MPLRINDEAHNFTAETTRGPITFHDWIVPTVPDEGARKESPAG